MIDTPRPRARLLPRTIRGLAVGIAIASGVVTVLLGAVTYATVHEELERQIDGRIEVETRALVEYDRKHGFEATLAMVRQRSEDASGYVPGVDPRFGRGMGYIVTDPTGRRRGGDLRAAMPPPGYSEFVHFSRQDGSTGVAQGMNSPLPSGGRLLVAVDRAVIRRMDHVLVRLFGIAFGTLLSVGLLGTIGFGRIVRNRLAAFERLANAVTAGNIDQRMPLDGTGVEFDRIAQVLNRMLERVSALVANLREVSTGLAHDLRTPLSRIRSRIELAEASAADPTLRALLDDTVSDMDDVLELFAGLLAIAELGGQSIRGRFAPLDLAAAVAEIAEAHRPAIEDGGRLLQVQLEPATVLGDRTLLQRLVGNLLDNAMVHTPIGTVISVGLRQVGDEVLLDVADDGPGVPVQDQGRMFDRLVRLDPSRSRPGHGLGLSMVSAIAAAHGGDIGVLPSDRGLTIRLKLIGRSR